MKYDPDVVILVVSPLSFAIAEIRRNKKEQMTKYDSESLNSRSVIRAEFGFSPRVQAKTKRTIKMFLPDRAVESIQLREAEAKVAEAERYRLAGAPRIDLIDAQIVERYTLVLAELVISLQAKGIDVILTSYPTLIDMSNIDQYAYFFAETRRFNVELSASGMFDVNRKLEKATRELAAETNAGFIDLDALIPNTTQYFADNFHYTDEGSRLVAELITAHILANTN